MNLWKVELENIKSVTERENKFNSTIFGSNFLRKFRSIHDYQENRHPSYYTLNNSNNNNNKNNKIRDVLYVIRGILISFS